MTSTAADTVVARRRAQREALLERARAWLLQLDDDLGVRAAVVVGSVARGDFHGASDVDVVLIADRLPDDPAERWQRVRPRAGVVSPVPWTTAEWRVQVARRNPLAIDAMDHGIWLAGAAAQITDFARE